MDKFVLGIMGTVRRWGTVAVLCALMQLATPRRADALFDWLDHLSGPGPFAGIEVQFRLFCVMDQPSVSEAVRLARDAEKASKNFAFASSRDATLATDVSAVTKTTGPAKLLDIAARAQTNASGIRSTGGSSLQAEPLAEAWEAVERAFRQAAVPRVRYTPGSFLWANCYDHPNGAGETYKVVRRDDPNKTESVQHVDRHPVFSLNANYRYYTTGTFFFSGPHTTDTYAHGKPIQLQIVEIQPSFPLTGRLDLVDGQTAIGWYQFTSDDENFGKVTGLVVEPVRFDLHFPARLLDHDPAPLLRVLYSLSLRWGLVVFPAGFSASQFNATGAAASRDLRGGEAIFSYGIVTDVGRLFGK